MPPITKNGIPRLVIAGTSSGVGKTTFTVGLVRALRERGLRVAVFKCGPDYLDPTYHARAAGTASHNLDGWMMGRDAVIETFARAYLATPILPSLKALWGSTMEPRRAPTKDPRPK